MHRFPQPCRKLSCLAILGALALPAVATQSFEKFWGLMTYNNRQHDWYYMIEPQIRLINRPGTYEQFLLNSGLGRPIRQEVQLWLGQTYSNTASSNAVGDDTSRRSTNEYRVWEQLLWSHPEQHYQFELRSRLEERHSFEVQPWAVRWRNRLLWTLPLYEPYAIMISDEFFFNLRSVNWVTTQTFDQNRAYLGLLKQITRNTRVSLGYLNQFLTRTPAEDSHTIVFNIFIQAD